MNTKSNSSPFPIFRHMLKSEQKNKATFLCFYTYSILSYFYIVQLPISIHSYNFHILPHNNRNVKTSISVRHMVLKILNTHPRALRRRR